MEINLTEIIIAVIGLCSTLITVFLVPMIQKSTSVKTQENIKLLAGIAIQAAETMYTSGQGEDKKEYVISYLKQHGVTVDDAVIEAYVYELINSPKAQ